MQIIFNPADFCFTWTNDWYEWDRKDAHKQALQARNQEAKRLTKEGKKVRKFNLPQQLISRGGLGSGKPHIEMVATCYGLNVYDSLPE